MRVLVNSDASVDIPTELAREVEATLEDATRLFASELTRIEVHFGDVIADQGGAEDKRCLLEARLAGFQPIAVNHHASTLQYAFDGALGKLHRALHGSLGKLRSH